MGVLSKVEMNLDIRDISIESLRCEWARFVHKPFFEVQDGVFFFFFWIFFCNKNILLHAGYIGISASSAWGSIGRDVDSLLLYTVV